MRKNNILITGGLGFVGFNLYKFLKNKKYNVYCLDKNKKNLKKLKLQKQKKIILGNFLNFSLVKKIIKEKKIDVIIHTGAITQVLDGINYPLETYRNNIQGTVNLLDSIRTINKKIVFIFSSTEKAYGELKKKEYIESDLLKAQYPYDLSKSSSDLICQSYSKYYDLKVGIIRCGNIFGPLDFNEGRIVPDSLISILKNKNIILRSNGKLKRDYIYINDVCNAYFLLMKKLVKNKKKLRIYNLGSKYNFSVIQLVNKILKIMKNSKTKVIIKNFSKKELINQKLNYSKIKRELKWSQKNVFEKSLAETISWYKKNFYLFK